MTNYALGRLFRRQFLLSDEESTAVPEWFIHVRTAGGHLHHCPDLPVAHLTDADGTLWTLIGEAIPTAGSGHAREQLSATATEDVSAIYRGWDGRWILVGHGEVHTDLHASIPAFYTNTALASTPGILRPGDLPDPPLTKADTCDWFPSPLSGWDDIRRLLPSQVLILENRRCRSRALPVDSGLSRADSLHHMRSALRRVVSNSDSGRVVVPLTAGWDSRLILAACVDADVEALCVTLTYPQISRADLNIPPQLAAMAGYQHLQVGPGRRAQANEEAGPRYDAQVGGHIRERDRRFLERGQYEWTRQGDVLLRGLSFDVLRHNHHVWPPAGVEDIDTLAEYFEPSPVQHRGFAAYLDWLQQDPQPLPFDHRFALEQGESAWSSMSEVALDLTQGRSIIPGNSWTFHEAAMAFPIAQRSQSAHHALLIEQIDPRLLTIPVNPTESRWRPRRMATAIQRRVTRAARNPTRMAKGTLAWTNRSSDR